MKQEILELELEEENIIDCEEIDGVDITANPVKVQGITIDACPDKLMKVAQLFTKSSFLPKFYRGGNHEETAANLCFGIQAGAEVGLAPLQSINAIAPINGRPCMWGDSTLALVFASNKLKNIEEYEEGEFNITIKNGVKEFNDDYTAVCKLTRIGVGGVDIEVIEKFSIKDARLAQLLSSNTYQKYPKRMLQMRARQRAISGLFPDVIKGIYAAENLTTVGSYEDYNNGYSKTSQVRKASSNEDLTKRLGG